MPTIKKQIDEHTDQLIIGSFVQSVSKIGWRGLQGVLDNLQKISAHLPPGLHMTDELNWDLLTEEEQTTLGDFIDTIGSAFNIYKELPAGRKAEIWKKVNDQLNWGGRRL
jgi:hypothetical protein